MCETETPLGGCLCDYRVLAGEPETLPPEPSLATQAAEIDRLKEQVAALQATMELGRKEKGDG